MTISKSVIISNRAFRHALFWLGIFIFNSFSVADRDLFQQFVETTLYRLPLLMIAAYLLNYWQVPALFRPKKYFLFGLSVFVTVIVLTLIYRIIGYLYLDQYCESELPFISLVDFPYHMLSFHFPALVMYFYKSNTQQYQERQRLNELQNQKVTTELKYLKAQLNPHFLFNTLNNLYSFVITNSPKAGDMVLQLSEILDYILYKSQNRFVAFSQELKTIENYIALQEIRYGNQLAVSFTKELVDETRNICPLLFLSLVENAFKHGATSSILSPKINIIISQTEATTSLSVWNTKPEKFDPLESAPNNGEERIGLSNVKQQLDLMYPEKYRLKIDNAKAYFSVELELEEIT